MSPRVKEPNAGADRPGGSGSRRSGGLGRSPPLSPPRKRKEELPEGCGAWRERKSRRQLHNIWQRRGPRDPEAAEHGGAGPGRRFLQPLRCQMCTPLPPAPHPHPSSPPGRAQHLLPVQSQFAGAPRTPRSPQRPGDTRPGHLWHPHPLMAFLAPAGRAGGSDQCTSPPGHCGTLAQTKPGFSAAPAPAEQSRAGGAGSPHPCRHFPPDPSCPESLWMCPGHCAAPANSWVRLNSKTGLAAGRENSLSLQK